MFFSHNRESSAPYLKLLDILNIGSIFKLKISLLAHKISQKCSENSRSQIVFWTDIFQKLMLGAPESLHGAII